MSRGYSGPGRGEGPLSGIIRQWAKIRRAAAIPDVRLHDLRHSFASVAINNGVSLMLIGRLLGHALPETTARYAHLEDSSIAEAASRVSQSLGQALRAGDMSRVLNSSPTDGRRPRQAPNLVGIAAGGREDAGSRRHTGLV